VEKNVGWVEKESITRAFAHEWYFKRIAFRLQKQCY